MKSDIEGRWNELNYNVNKKQHKFYISVRGCYSNKLADLLFKAQLECKILFRKSTHTFDPEIMKMLVKNLNENDNCTLDSRPLQ